MVRLVAIAQAAQDLHRAVDRRLVDAHLLEALLERRVALEVLAVLVERGGADRLQLAAGERRLADRGRVDRASAAPAPTRLWKLVDEEDDVAPPRDLPSPSSTAPRTSPRYFGAGDERAVERVDLLVLQELGDLVGGDPGGEASTTAVLPTPGSPISTGLFFCRLERICITRSISVWRPTIGPTPVRCGLREIVELVEQLGAFAFSPEPSEPRRCRLRAGEHADDLIANLLGVGVEVEQDAQRRPRFRVHEAEQDVPVPM